MLKTFEVEATDRQGKYVRFSFNALSESAVRREIQQQGFSLLRLSEHPFSQRYTEEIEEANQNTRIKIHPIAHGIEIDIPVQPRESDFIKSTKGTGEKPIEIIKLSLLFLLFSLLGFQVISDFLSLLKEGTFDWFLLLGLCLWSFCGVCLLFAILMAFFGHEKIIINSTTVTIGKYIGAIGTAKTYEIRHISKLRRATVENPTKQFLFNYNGQLIAFGEDVRNIEAPRLFNQLSDILTFQCQSVQSIVFGTLQFAEHDPCAILQNPDVSELAFPFVHLRQIIIYAESYDLLQVEQFMTYAINHIGQKYLKTHVDVHVYGELDTLHQNVQNNFNNFCKQVHLHKGTADFFPLSRQG